MFRKCNMLTIIDNKYFLHVLFTHHLQNNNNA